MDSRILVLGPVEVVGPDGPIAIREGHSRTLLCSLVVAAPMAVAAEVLIEQLWGDDQPRNARNALQVLVSQVRKRLEPVRDSLAIERHGDGYRLVCGDPTIIDMVRFEQLVRALPDAFSAPALPAAAEDALRRADEALALWRGAPLADVTYDEFAQREIVRLTEVRATAAARRAAALLALGRNSDAVEALQALVALHPLRESIWGALIIALYRSRRQADALRAYASAHEHLVGELGVEPGPQLRDLERRVLAQDPTLDSDPPVARSMERAPSTAAAAKRSPDSEVDRHDGAGGEGAISPWRVASRVPEPFSTLVGRGFELDHVAQLALANRLTTLTGTGGVGKSRLAVEVARRLQEMWPTRFVELGAVSPDADIALLVASALGVASVPGGDPLDAVVAAVGDDPLLLVLDTCEHVIDPVADLAANVLRRTRRAHILATSRQPLGLAGEVVWTVPPLDLADPDAGTLLDVSASGAVRLFAERAAAVRPGFVLDDDNAAAVATICRTLDGLPLAIELAAARVNVLSPARIVERLSDRFALLATGSRSAETRQRSLRALLEWSYDLLDADTRAFFDRLSVFAGSFALDAAAEIVGPGLDGEPLALLGALVEHSLVASIDSDRYIMLDTLRAFAAGNLERDPATARAVRDGHAHWFLGVATRADPKSHGPLPHAWPGLRAEAENCVAALHWFVECGRMAEAARLTGALAGFWMLEGQIAQADHWLGQVRDCDLDDATAASVGRGIGVLELYQSRFADSQAAMLLSVAAARRTDDAELVASCLLTLGSALWGLGDFAGSRRALEESAALFSRAGDRRGEGFALARVGRTMLAQGDGAIATLERARSVLAASGDGWMSCVAAEHLASALLRSGRGVEAVRIAREAVDLAVRVGSLAGRMTAMLTLCHAFIATDELPAAQEAASVALSDALRNCNPGWAADALDALAAVLTRQGHVERAVELVASSDALRAERRVAVARTAAEARDEFVESLRSRIGPDRFTRLARSGATLDRALLVEQRRG